MRPNRILICGGRNFTDKNYVYHTLDNLRQYFNSDFCIIVGGATGADAHGAEWACDRGIPCITMRANWNHYGKKAGSLINEWMLKYGMPDLVIAFDGGPGTAHMKRIAKMAGVPVHEV